MKKRENRSNSSIIKGCEQRGKVSKPKGRKDIQTTELGIIGEYAKDKLLDNGLSAWANKEFTLHSRDIRKLLTMRYARDEVQKWHRFTRQADDMATDWVQSRRIEADMSLLGKLAMEAVIQARHGTRFEHFWAALQRFVDNYV